MHIFFPVIEIYLIFESFCVVVGIRTGVLNALFAPSYIAFPFLSPQRPLR